ncbi:antitoxin Xre/MbcA/ParS toxin-binding domain-containing protein [Pseudidiomarina sp.]|uniref:antitoxin Xre/MbcA/ParS toxin-binding domain-containing protein n=1 Tax=Pseudidiomarina sp. TaxID=2081707 RepID=UPI003A97DF0A
MSGAQKDENVVWRAALELFEGDRAAAVRWLHREAKGLGGKRPVDVMQEEPQQVLDLIGRLEHGSWELIDSLAPVGMLHRWLRCPLTAFPDPSLEALPIIRLNPALGPGQQ